MDTKTWAMVKRLFGEALSLEAGERRGWVERECADEEVRREVLNLLEEYERSEDFLENSTPAVQRAVEEALEGPLEGQRIGSWRLVRQIGRGGMGVVYEAVREGEDFQARFALKLIRAGLASEKLAERFRHERRVLAGLSHPGIAALVDGGTTPEGLPYLVMEYVEGVPVDQWIRERKPDLRERVRLVAAICEAVRHAHERLVIHRDLKPGNILVTPDGRPKLLDFGIAKLLGDDGDAAAQTITYVLTPEYASPEQITGGPVTTATDIYSLGVLLYVLLAERRPYELSGLPPLEAMRRVVEAEPEPPSAAAPAEARRLLRGDLDNIILKCLRKNPAERYRSADALARELHAWLEGRPVSATPPSLAYRLGKWARRNRGQAAAAAALLVSILAGAAATAWQAREAQLARVRAEQRALEIQKLSRALVFEINGALLKFPGSTEARALLLDRAMQFFDGAARTAEDPRLLLELAEGYRRLGNVLGSSFSDNLGRRQEALHAFTRGLDAVQAANRQGAAEAESLRVQAGLLVEAGLAASGLGRREETRRYADELAQVTGRIEGRLGGSAWGKALAAVNWSQLAMLRGLLDERDEAIRLYGKSLALFDSLPREEASSRGNLSQKAFAHKRLGALLMAKDLEAAERQYSKALEIDRELVRSRPGDHAQLYNMTFALSDLGLIEKTRRDYGKSFQYFSEAAQIRDRFYAADPKSIRVLNGVSNVHCQLSLVLARMQRFGEARRESAVCRKVSGELEAAEPERHCGHGAYALLHSAEISLVEAASAQGARRARLAAEAGSLIARASREREACATPFSGFAPKLREVEQLRAQLGL